MVPDTHDDDEVATSNVATLPIRPSAPRRRKLVLVDFENIPNVSLDGIDADTEVIVFIGAQQKTAPIELAMTAQKLGDRLKWQRISASGKNALDFFIACELGRVLASEKSTHCTVVSNDTGFDPLIKHLKSVGLHCVRQGSTPNQAPKKAPARSTQSQAPPPDGYERVLEMLNKSAKNRPAKRTTLKNHITAHFQKNKSDKEVEQLIARLQADGRISLNGEKVTYKL